MEIRNTSLWFLLHKVIFLKAYFKTVYLFLFTVNFPSVLPPLRWNPLLLLAEYHLPIVLTSHLIELHFHFFFLFSWSQEQETLSYFCELTSLQKDLYHAD